MAAERDIILFRTAQTVDPGEIAGRTAVVIDVLRATTTIAAAMAAGAARVLPCRSPEEAREISAGLEPRTVVLGGERHGLKIDDFDLDNSPLSYSADRVAGKTVVITTTNGTEAMGRASLASQLVAASFVNAASVSGWLADRAEPLAFICAGTEGKPSPEDELCAGLLIQRLAAAGRPLALSAAAAGALAEWQKVTSLAQALRACYHARHLDGLGFAADVDYAARLDLLPVLPLRRHRELVDGSREH